jgi:hypothetical protein
MQNSIDLPQGLQELKNLPQMKSTIDSGVSDQSISTLISLGKREHEQFVQPTFNKR